MMSDQSRDPYGVPTGYVPRLNPATLRPYAPDHPVEGTRTLPDFGVHGATIAQAVDNYLLMERKARALDTLMTQIEDYADNDGVRVSYIRALVRDTRNVR